MIKQTQFLNNEPIYFYDSLKQIVNLEITKDTQINLIDYTSNSDLTLNINVISGSVKLVYFALGKENDVKSLKINATNKKPNTGVEIIAKAVQFANSSVSVKCAGTILENCSNAKSLQELRAITFGPETKTAMHPILNIYHNQVEAGHAATVGKVDPKLIYYLMSRGLSKVNSVNFLVNSFIQTAFSDQLVINSIFESVKELYEEKQ
jgi:Fe-S cluster assembly protein SufD